jgi:hypothetical protein
VTVFHRIVSLLVCTDTGGSEAPMYDERRTEQNTLGAPLVRVHGVDVQERERSYGVSTTLTQSSSLFRNVL